MLPNFLIIGAPRSGTTTLYESLKQHPQIFLSPVKEPMFFLLDGGPAHYPGPKSPQGVRRIDQYQSLFQGAKTEKAIGEASPCYLFSPKATLGLKQNIPDAKFIVILRNPVDRAYSHFLFHRMEGTEPLADFEAAMDAEDERIRMGWFIFWCYRGIGYYGRQIERYLSHFPREKFRFFLMEDLAGQPQELFKEIFRFLEVDDGIRVRLPLRYNPAGVPRNQWFHEFLVRPNAVKNLMKPILSPNVQSFLLTHFMGRNLVRPSLERDVRKRILAMYQEDILKTQDLIHRDLSAWLNE
jgi:hypothetical protein